MKLSKKLKAFLEDARKNDSYWAEQAKLEFAAALEQQRRRAEMTYASIAKKIGSSAAYITKVFRGDSNVTIDTMVKLVRATGGHLDIRIVDGAAAVTHWDLSHYATKPTLVLVSTNTMATLKSKAANHDAFTWEKAVA